MDTIAAIQNGDRKAFEEVFGLYHERIYFYVLSKTSSAWLAEEATQLAFIKLWQYRHSLSPEMDLWPQLFRMARSCMIDLVRSQQRIRRVLQAQSSAGDSTTQAWDQVLENDVYHRLLAIVEKMPPVRQKVFKMSRLQGMTYSEIAMELSISIKTVEAHMAKALGEVKRLLIVLYVLLWWPQ